MTAEKIKKPEEEKEQEIEEKANIIVEKEVEKKLKGEEVEKEIVPKEEPKLEEPKKDFRGRPIRKSREELEREAIAAWEPKTKLGREVKDGKVKDIDDILDSNLKILESEIVDSLITLTSDLISIGQSKGKFGGGKRRAWRQTQRKKKEGNVATFSTLAVVGDEDGHVGIGSGRATETLPARDKATRKAKLNIIKVVRACSAFDCDCPELHTVPFKITGKSGSVKVTLIPAPQGTGLAVANELKKILNLAGIKDIYSRTSGRKRTTFNLIKACMDALEQTNRK